MASDKYRSVDALQAGRRGSGVVIALLWAGFAAAALLAPILKRVEETGLEGLDGSPVLLQRQAAAARTAISQSAASHSAHGPFRMRPARTDKIVRELADLYAMHCACPRNGACRCAEDASRRVSAALDNAVAREFAPPSLYYRSKDSYAFRLRGFQRPKTHLNGGLVHDKSAAARLNSDGTTREYTGPFLGLEPINTSWRAPRGADGAPELGGVFQVRPAPPYHPTTTKKQEGRNKKKRQLRKAQRPVRRMGTDPYLQSRLQSTTTRAPAQLKQRTTQLLMLHEADHVALPDEDFSGKHPTIMEEEDYLQHLKAACEKCRELEACMDSEEAAVCKELPHERGMSGDTGPPVDDILESPWFEDWLRYAKLMLEDGEVQEARASSGLPADAAFEIPYQEGQEADWADWEMAHEDDAFQPLRLVEGESNFPEMDANINAPGAVLEDYPGQAGGGESYASFLKHPQGEGGEMQADPSSVNGWLTDADGY